MMLVYKKPLFISLLSSSLCGLFLLSPATAMEEEPLEQERPTITLSINHLDDLGNSAGSSMTVSIDDLLHFIENDVVEKKYFFEELFKNILKDTTFPYYHDIAQKLFSSNDDAKKEKGKDALKEILKDTNHLSYYHAAQDLFTSEDQKDKEVSLVALRTIAKDETHQFRYYAASHLLCSDNEEDQKAGTIVLREIIEDETHQNYLDAAKDLATSNNKKDKKAGTAILRKKFEVESDPSQKLQIAIDTRNIEYLTQVALDPSQPKEMQLKAISNLCPDDINDPHQIESISSTISSLVKDETLPIGDRLSLIEWLKEADISEPVFTTLLPAFLDDPENPLLNDLLWLMLDSSYPNIQDQAENIFFKNPAKFAGSPSLLPYWLQEHLRTSEENKKGEWLRRISEDLESPSLDDTEAFNAACFVLKMKDQDPLEDPAKKVFLKMIDTQLEEFLRLHAKKLVRAVKDVELKDKIISLLFDLTQRENPLSNCDSEKALRLLLNHSDEKTRTTAIDLCQKLFDSIQSEQTKLAEDSLSGIGLALTKIEEGKVLAEQIRTLLLSKFEQVLAEPNAWSLHRFLLKFFMKSDNETQQHQTYNVLKNIIIHGEEIGNEEDIEDVAYLIVNIFGGEHPWSQEVIELTAKRQNRNHPNSAFSIHKQLKKKVKQPVNHHLPNSQLDDGRSVAFNLQSLQKPRSFAFIPMKHKEFISLVEQLIDEAEKHQEEFKLLAEPSLAAAPKSAIDIAKKSFFRFLLDEDEGIKETKKVSLISQKLRQILATAKSLPSYDLGEKEASSSQELSPRSQLILSLLNNVLTCPTGKDDGIDQTYRLLTHRRGTSEDQMGQERLTDDMKEFFMEEMRCIREGLLDGSGPVVHSLLKLPMDSKIEEPPHQEKYIRNLLGHEVGLFLDDEDISFDPNGGAALKSLRDYSKQEALDMLYTYHTPQKVIRYFHDQFASQGFKGKVDGKYETWKIMGELLPDRSEDPNYVIYDDDIPQGITSLAVAEFLIKTSILDVVKSH
jgi:hypothetical protein